MRDNIKSESFRHLFLFLSIFCPTLDRSISLALLVTPSRIIYISCVYTSLPLRNQVFSKLQILLQIIQLCGFFCLFCLWDSHCSYVHKLEDLCFEIVSHQCLYIMLILSLLLLELLKLVSTLEDSELPPMQSSKLFEDSWSHLMKSSKPAVHVYIFTMHAWCASLHL